MLIQSLLTKLLVNSTLIKL